MKQTQLLQFHPTTLNDCLKLLFSMAREEPNAGKSYDPEGIVNLSVKICTMNSDPPPKAPVLHEQFMQHLRCIERDAFQS